MVRNISFARIPTCDSWLENKGACWIAKPAFTPSAICLSFLMVMPFSPQSLSVGRSWSGL